VFVDITVHFYNLNIIARREEEREDKLICSGEKLRNHAVNKPCCDKKGQLKPCLVKFSEENRHAVNKPCLEVISEENRHAVLLCKVSSDREKQKKKANHYRHLWSIEPFDNMKKTAKKT
jgi:hypothetical protein